MKEFVLSGGVVGTQKIDYRAELNEEQLDVVLHGDGPCLVLAGAGSGKTRTITYRVAFLLESGVPPEEILLLTFTNKAAKQMTERVAELMQGFPTGLWSGTFHSVANRILRQYAPLAGYSPSFTIMDQDDAVDLVKYCVKDLKIDTKERRFPSPSVLQSMISYSRNSGQAISEVIENKYGSFSDLIPTIERIAEVYASRKLAANAMDFDDLLLLLARLLNTHSAVCEALSRRFRYILVDEYQDTNSLQASIVRALASVHGNLLVVGDDAQSIYSFRAAQIQNILRFPDLFKGAQVFRLQTNYRSSPQILSVANGIIKQNVDQFQKELKAVRGAEEKPNLVPTSDNRQEAQYVAEQILHLRDDGTPLAEIAVLFRAAHHSQALEMELSRRDIPYEYRGGLKFFERSHIKDVVSYLRLIANPKDAMAWMRALSHQTGIGDVTAGKIMEAMKTLEVIEEALDRSVATGRAESGWRALTTTIKKMVMTDKTPPSLIRAVAGSGYQDYLQAEYPNAADRLEDIEQFALFAEQYTDLNTFLEEVTLKDDYGAVRENGGYKEEKMVLSTIHQAKGLEWDAVFVINVTDGAFPHPRALGEPGGIEEERRLFYVATTRARKQLFLTYPITSGYETMELRQPSMFLEEIPKELLEEVRLKRMASPGFLSGVRSLGLRPRPSVDSDNEPFGDGPMIVLDDLGERKPARPSRGFLSNVDDL